MRKFSLLTMFLSIFMVVTVFAQKGYVNPAAKYCEMLGYRYEIVSTKTAGDEGVVHLPDGSVVNAWDFFKGKVGQEYSYPALKGYEVQTEVIKENGYTVERAVCIVPVKGENMKISLEEFMEMNGDALMAHENRNLSETHSDAKVDPNFQTSKALPTSFDWRNYNGNSYIGAPRDQGSCGSCYAFGATAAAEGTYNFATGKYGSSTADFSESYIAWCLSTMSAYSGHFSGCNGADYDYMELQALVDVGTVNESYFPYVTTATQSCPSAATNAPKTKFASWNRVACNSTDAIKTAIMTYGVVDAAVYVSTDFQNYTGGVFSDASTSCTASPCYNTTTNHAISLVGWGYDATKGDYWILRNSWGSSWGESGYMRIAVTSARVGCSVCYLTYASTGPTVPSVTTTDASTITTTSAISGGNVTADGGASVTARGICYSTSQNPTTANSTVASGSGTGSFTANMTGLAVNTTYYVRAYATNSIGTAYGTQISFKTLDNVTSLPLPVSQTFASTMPTNWTTQNVGTSITERWSMSNTANAGGAAYEAKCSYQQVSPGTTRLITPPVNTVGVSQVTFSFKHMLDAYGTGVTLRVQTSNDKTNWTNTTWSAATTATNIAATTVDVAVTSNLNSANTYFALVADGNLYQIDYWYIDNISITAGSNPGTLPTVTTTAASSITKNTATSGGNVTSAGSATVTERGICYSTTSTPTTANSKVVSGSGTGSYTANLSGLVANTTYYVRAYAINSVGTAYGSQVSFTTLPDDVTEVTVGTGTSTQGYPINCYYGYERSASIYTAAEIGRVGSISKLSWYPTLTTTYNVPIKIYIKHTTASTITSATWATSISGATLVYSGTMAGTTANVWKLFTLSTAFNYTGGSNNLMVLVETNYGGTGAGSSTGAAVRYSTATSKHMYVRADNSAPTAKGTVTSYRPNIKISFAAAKGEERNDLINESNSIVSVYPNPTRDIATITSNGEVKSIEVYSISGAKVYSNSNITNSASNEVDLSNFQNGVYVVIVNDGAMRHTLKLIKQ